MLKCLEVFWRFDAKSLKNEKRAWKISFVASSRMEPAKDSSENILFKGLTMILRYFVFDWNTLKYSHLTIAPQEGNLEFQHALNTWLNFS